MRKTFSILSLFENIWVHLFDFCEQITGQWETSARHVATWWKVETGWNMEKLAITKYASNAASKWIFCTL